MSNYIGFYGYPDYPRRNLTNQNSQKKYTEKRRMNNSHFNKSKRRDRSAILRRAINKRYKEDINKNFDKTNYNDLDKDSEESSDNSEGSEINDYLYKANTLHNFNNLNYIPPLYKQNNIPFQKRNYIKNVKNNDYTNKSQDFYYNDNDYNEKALINRIRNIKNRSNYTNNRNYVPNRNNKTIYDEFYINFNSRINKDDYPINSFNRNKTQYPYIQKENSFNYKERAQPICDNDYNIFNNKFRYIYKPKEENRVDYKKPYQKRIINYYIFNDNKENGMTNTYFFNKKNDKVIFRNNTDKNNTFIKRNISYSNNIDNNNYNINYDLINDEYNDDYNKEIAEYEDNLIKKYDKDKKITDFTDHIIQYCLLYYTKIIQKILNFLKSQKSKPKIIKKKKTNVITIHNNNNTNIMLKKRNIKPINYIKDFHTQQDKLIKPDINKNKKTEEEIERIPYYKNNNPIIERIKDNNKSVSPSRNNQVEMFRNINELNKKFEIISNRKNKMSYNTSRTSLNDISFYSDNRSIYNSIEKNKEIWENNINKERERKKYLEKKKNEKKDQLIKEKENNFKKEYNKKTEKNKKDILELMKNCEDLKKKIKKAIEEKKMETINDKDIKNKKNIENQKSKTITSLDRKNIRDKYKKRKINKIKDKNEMINVKKICTKDKLIQINMKYLNYIPMKNKRINANNKNDFKSYQPDKNCFISIFAIKKNNDLKDNRNKFSSYQPFKNCNLSLISTNNNGLKIQRLPDNNKNNLYHKLSSIKEDDLNDLSDSKNSEENQK